MRNWYKTRRPKELSGDSRRIDYRWGMDLMPERKLAVSNRVRMEMQSLASSLEFHLKKVSSQGSRRMRIAAGMTRLRKIEFIKAQERSNNTSLQMDCRKLEDSLLLRVRGRRYSSVAMAYIQATGPSPNIEIRVEHEQGVALKIEIPVRYKRLGCLSTGESTTTATTVRWFLRECPIILDASK